MAEFGSRQSGLDGDYDGVSRVRVVNVLDRGSCGNRDLERGIDRGRKVRRRKSFGNREGPTQNARYRSHHEKGSRGTGNWGFSAKLGT